MVRQSKQFTMARIIKGLARKEGTLYKPMGDSCRAGNLESLKVLGVVLRLVNPALGRQRKENCEPQASLE